jgi:hypothetical protein
VTERDLFLVDPIAASDIFLDGHLAGKSAVRDREVPRAWNRGFLTCLVIALVILLFQRLT